MNGKPALLIMMLCIIGSIIGCSERLLLNVVNVKIDEPAEKEQDNEVDTEYLVRSFEPAIACDGFELSEADVREFFSKAHLIPSDKSEKLADWGGKSRCMITGDITLQDGEKPFWNINKSRYGTIFYQDMTRYDFFCKDCQSNKYYSSSGDELKSWLPIVESVKFEKNGGWIKVWPEKSSNTETPEICKQFILTEDDVREFFNVARAVLRREITSSQDLSRCYAMGTAVLKSGRNANWLISQERYGIMYLADTENTKITLYFYCAKCSNKLYYDNRDN